MTGDERDVNLDLFVGDDGEDGGPADAAADGGSAGAEAAADSAPVGDGSRSDGAEKSAAPPAGEGSSGESGAAGARTAADTGEPTVWSVSEVNAAVRALLEDALPRLWVGGEVANWTKARSGHRYFTLKDESAQLRCVMWRDAAARLPADPEEGMEVRAFGELTLYERRGTFQLVVRRLEAEGEEGLWRIAFEKLRAKLEAEGLLAPERKRPLPPFPGTVGVVTSTTGAALRDVLTVIRRRAPWTRVVVRGSRVQGEGASEELAGALGALAGTGLPDVIIIGRGGGSIEDLWAFNEEPVARAVASCPVPVISAVGHEVDVTISDLVADRRAPTPSAAAEAAVPDRRALETSLREVRTRMEGALRGAVERRRNRVRELAGAVERGVRRRIEGLRQRLSGLATKVEALSPLSTLRRGYAVPLDAAGTVLRGTGDFEEGMEYTLRVADGRIDSRVEGIEEDGGPGGGPHGNGEE